MKPKNLYLGLCVLGTVLPYSQLMPFLREYGLDFRLFLEQMFSSAGHLLVAAYRPPGL